MKRSKDNLYRPSLKSTLHQKSLAKASPTVQMHHNYYLQMKNIWYYNEKLALFITDIRREIAEKVESNDLSVPGKAQEAEKVESVPLEKRKGKTQEEKQTDIKSERMESGLIPEKDLLSKELSKYNMLIDKYDDNMIRESIIRYIEAVNSLIRSKYGFPAPVTCMTKKHLRYNT